VVAVALLAAFAARHRGGGHTLSRGGGGLDESSSPVAVAIRVAPPSLRLIRATPSSAHGPAPCRLPDRLLLLFSFSRSVIGFASPSPTAVDSRIIDIGFDNTDFLISFDCVAGVACGVTGTPACAAPPRLHVDLRRLVFATTDREAPPSTSPSPSLSSPRTPSA